MATQAEFISVLHQSHTQAKTWHHQTDSYSAHKALGIYYEDIVGLVDGLVESTQGIEPRITGYQTKPLVDYVDVPMLLAYFKGLYDYVQKERVSVFQASWQQNQIDEISALIASTLFKLSLK
jgi:hypothetical protein